MSIKPTFSILNNYQYEGKSKFQKTLDLISSPCRKILGGRNINLIDHTSQGKIKVSEKLGNLILSLVLLPVGIISFTALIVKLVYNASSKEETNKIQLASQKTQQAVSQILPNEAKAQQKSTPEQKPGPTPAATNENKIPATSSSTETTTLNLFKKINTIKPLIIQLEKLENQDTDNLLQMVVAIQKEFNDAAQNMEQVKDSITEQQTYILNSIELLTNSKTTKDLFQVATPPLFSKEMQKDWGDYIHDRKIAPLPEPEKDKLAYQRQIALLHNDFTLVTSNLLNGVVRTRGGLPQKGNPSEVNQPNPSSVASHAPMIKPTTPLPINQTKIPTILPSNINDALDDLKRSYREKAQTRLGLQELLEKTKNIQILLSNESPHDSTYKERVESGNHLTLTSNNLLSSFLNENADKIVLYKKFIELIKIIKDFNISIATIPQPNSYNASSVQEHNLVIIQNITVEIIRNILGFASQILNQSLYR